jgi:hypothetical protein
MKPHSKKKFFDRINFNKRWNEDDWEKYFQAQDEYRLAAQVAAPPTAPLARIKYTGSDEVVAFEPVRQAYGMSGVPSVVYEIQGQPFEGDQNPADDYHPATDEDPHYWKEGAPLATVLIYRDCCRFAICTHLEVEKYLKRKDAAYRRKYSAEFEALRFHANWVAINIAHGHVIGYSEERIRGNIAKCRRAIKHADLCVSLLSRISMRTKSVRLRKELFSFAAQLRNALFTWVDELRVKNR